MGNSMKRSAMYLRVSTGEQKEKQSIRLQRTVGERYIRDHAMPRIEWYCDDGISGTVPLVQRPEGARLLADIRANTIDTVFVYKLDRLGRDPWLLLQALHDFEAHGVQLQSLTEPFDTTLPTGRFLVTVLGAFAGFERETIVQRAIEGTNRLAQAGSWLGGIVPYGYRVEHNGQRRLLVKAEAPIPGCSLSEAEVVRRLYQLTIEQEYSCTALAEDLNALGIPSGSVLAEDEQACGKRLRKTAQRWMPGRIRNLLTSPTYKGIHLYGRRSSQKREVIVRQVPALVSPDCWEHAQQVLARHRRYLPTKRASRRPYLLRGLITCGLCQLTYSGTSKLASSQQERASYVCNGASHLRGRYGAQGQHCPSARVDTLMLETLVWHDIDTFFRHPGEALAHVRTLLTDQQGSLTRLQDTREQTCLALAQQQREKDQIIQLFRTRRISESTLDRQLDSIEQEEEALQQAEHRCADNDLTLLAQRLAQPLDWTARRELVTTLVERIRVDTIASASGQKTARITICTVSGPFLCPNGNSLQGPAEDIGWDPTGGEHGAHWTRFSTGAKGHGHPWCAGASSVL